jgi:hypothetical protein
MGGTNATRETSAPMRIKMRINMHPLPMSDINHSPSV